MSAPATIIVAALAAGGCDSLPWADKDDGASSSGTSPLTSCSGPADEVPDDLSCTGLYSDFAAKTIAPTSKPYAPGAALWSDGLEKSRYIFLPEGTKIYTKEFDSWQFPVGTKLWKEFRRGDRKVETRYFAKVKTDKWIQSSYVWSEDGTKATRSDGKDIQVDGKPYHIPKLTECNQCHAGRPDRVLGFEAVLLALPGATGLTLPELVKQKLISNKPTKTELTLPDPGMGVLHANCGITCHNANPGSKAFATELHFRLAFDDVSAAKPLTEWPVVATTVGVDARLPGWEGEVRITPGAPDTSLIVKVMRLQGDGQMPPLGRTEVDEVGVSAVESWIRSLPASAPPPPVATGDAGAPKP